MANQIFVNLHVADLKKAMDFYTVIGFKNNPTFTDNTAAAMQWTNEINVMLLTHDKFRQFTHKDLSDARKTTEVMNALAVDTKELVDELADKAEANGGKIHGQPQDYGFMYQRSFEDPDGHVWELLYMDMSKFPGL